MGQEYPARTFKSGNSVALRLPAALGIKPGESTTIVQDEEGNLIIKRADQPRKKFNIEKVWGIGKDWGLRYIRPEDRVFDERPSVVASQTDNLNAAAK